ncbi:MAG: ribosome maturation factor RimM [Rickettsiales bacterium]|jgi:16S rRNA processing protein RimM|nr:ribosome maturation factor RimM [Rickettsiales bacterium]
MSKKILIGKIISAFGIRGEVKIISYCQNPLDIGKYSLTNQKNEQIKLSINNKKIIGENKGGESIIIARINDINNRSDAEKYHQMELFINKQDLKPTDEDEFYFVDLIGLEVLEESNDESVGKVVNVNDFGAGGMIEIEFNQNFLSQNLGFAKIENFAFKNAIFPKINLEKNYIKIIIPNYLLEK